MNTPALYELFLKYPKICTDSRKSESGSLYFALKGETFDGNKFAEKALENCEYAIVDDASVIKSNKYILVENALEKLQRLAQYHRKRLGLPIIAITGTNGKTTTKELIARVLATKYNVGFTQGNLNNHIGVPITLLSFNETHEFGIVEMGANHIGEIAFLCKIAAPDFGIITNVGKAHLEGFGSFEGVKKAKGELYNYLYENDGVAFVNYDNEQLEDMKPPHSVIYYGTNRFTHCQGRIEENGTFLSIRWIGYEDESVHENEIVEWLQEGKLIKTQLYGKYNFENVLAAICIGYNFNVSDEQIKSAIESYSPQNNRSQVLKTERNTLFIDSYNANPSSMKAALENFNQLESAEKLIILGDMFELGSVSLREHGVILALLKELNFTHVILVGSNFYNYCDQPEFIFMKNNIDLANYLLEQKFTGKTILIKGSRGMHLEDAIALL